MCFAYARIYGNFFKLTYSLIIVDIQVACALLMAGQNLNDHVEVKNILIDMGIYFQVQVKILRYFFMWFPKV